MKNGLIRNAAISVIFAEFAALLFLIISAAMSYGKNDPDSMLGLYSIVAHITGITVCGILTGVTNSESSITYCLATSLIHTAIQIIITLLISDNSLVLSSCIIKSLLICASSFGVAYTVSSFKPKKKHKRKRRQQKRKK